MGCRKTAQKILIYRYKLLFIALLLNLPVFLNVEAQQLAFPEAVGAAAYITGGRGGSVYHVTNLNNSGAGSFRDAVSSSNRIIVFDVSGTIELTSSLYISSDNLTIAGQSAPEGGITVTGSPVHFQNSDNIIVRYIRFRPNYNSSGNVDALNAYNCTNFIADHCSVSWGGDEAFSLIGNSSNVTIQNCIFGESATGMIAGDSNSPISDNFSIVGNLWYNISHRFPNVAALRVDVINNVVHNWFTRLKVVANHDFTQLNEINNFYQSGVKTGAPLSPDWSINWLDIGSSSQRSNIRIYTDGNVYPSFLEESGDDWTLYRHRFNVSGGAYAGTSQWDPAHPDFQLSSQLELLGEAPDITSAADALINVPNNAGANMYLNSDGSSGTYHDNIDSTYLTNVINNTSEFYTYPPTNITSQPNYVNFHNSVSSVPINTRPGNYYVSSPHIPEDWFSANVPNGQIATDLAPSGYTWIEEFLNQGGGSQSSQVNAGSDQSICEGESTVLTASGATSYLWSTGETTASINVSPNTTTTYTVTGDPGTQNESSDTVIVNVTALPEAYAGEDVSICSDQDITLTASGGGDYLWSTGETTQSITVNPDSDTTYTVTVSINDCEDTDSVTVFVTATPIADAGENVTILEGESTILTANGGQSYLWSTGETTQSITVSPILTTSYNVTVSNGECSDDAFVTVFVEEPVVANAGEDQTICEGEGATLTASGGTNYLWSTGETTPTISVNPMVTTTYSVTVSDDFSSDTDEVTVNVNEVPIAYAGEDQSIQIGELATLTATGGDTYLWSTGETTQSIEVSPTESTTYMVTVFSNGCEDFDDVEVIVEGVTANAGDDMNICSGESVTLTATGGDFYVWNTGETTASIEVSPEVTTTYSVEVSDGFSFDTDEVTVFVSEAPTANAGNDESICLGETILLTASGGETYLWNTGETSQTIEVSPEESTTYTVTVFNAACQDSDSVTVTVNPNPIADAGNDITINEGEITTLTASGGDTYEWSTGETTQSIQVSPIVDTTYSVIVSQNGCEDIDEVTVFVNEAVEANAGEDVTICQGSETILTATGGDTYLWSTGETTQSIVVNPIATSTYTVIVSNEFSSDTDEVIVNVNPLPDVQVTDDVTILQGDFVTLSATGANSYVWDNGATEPNIAVNPSSTTTYSVTGYINDCSETEEIIVNVIDPVEANAGQDQTICLGSSITLTANGGDNYLWSTGDTTQSITVSPEVETTYTVIVSNELDSDADEVTVMVDNCEIELPNEEPVYEFSLYTERGNPSMIIVRLSGLEGESSLFIHDIAGNLVHSQPIQDNDGQQQEISLNTANYSQGVYVITLQEQNRSTPKQVLFR